MTILSALGRPESWALGSRTGNKPSSGRGTITGGKAADRLDIGAEATLDVPNVHGRAAAAILNPRRLQKTPN
jgi:hypothetical protein